MFAVGLLLAANAQMAQPGAVNMAQPGAVNYIEGQVSLDGQTVAAGQVGSLQVSPGQILETQNGRAEMLLTPGVFLRLSDQSAVRMVSPSITDTRVELIRGEAMMEAARVERENHLVVLDHGASALIGKRGIYEFRADVPTVVVFDGEAQVQQADRTIDVGKGKELLLGQKKPQKFNREGAESGDSLYAWSKLRSEYVAEANMSTAQTFVVGAPGWYGTGWYWNPYFDSFAFMPGDGFFYSPFGWGGGFYSPGYFGAYAPYGYRGFGGRPGFAGRPGFGGRPGFTTAPRMSGRSFGGGSFGGGHVGGFGGGGHFGGGRR
jgi:hypothetical protein